MSNTINGKVVITGASSGLGEATARGVKPILLPVAMCIALPKAIHMPLPPEADKFLFGDF